MTQYLGDNKFYVMNGEKLVYEVNEYKAYYGGNIYIHLELVAGWDYVNPDENDVQGWVGAENFVEEVQTEIVQQLFLEEGMKEALTENGYTILKEENIPNTLMEIIEKHNEA